MMIRGGRPIRRMTGCAAAGCGHYRERDLQRLGKSGPDEAPEIVRAPFIHKAIRADHHAARGNRAMAGLWRWRADKGSAGWYHRR